MGVFLHIMLYIFRKSFPKNTFGGQHLKRYNNYAVDILENKDPTI